MAKKGGDLVTHCNSARSRIVGEGSLKATLQDSAGNIVSLAEGTLSETSGKSITHLANFRAERISYEIFVEDIDEWFLCSNQYAYVNPTAASYPQL